MNHGEVRELIHPYVDGEIDLMNAREIERHLAQCDECRSLEQRLRKFSAAVGQSAASYRAPAGLRRQIRRAVAREAKDVGVSLWIPIAVAASLVVLAGVFFLTLRGFAQRDVADELVANHVRSLLATHLVDVASSDQHTVKPWFDGKVDFAPDVRDLAAEGFPLVGGRLDYLDNRTVVALVYDRHKHPINVFVVPQSAQTSSRTGTLKRRGYNLVHWSRDGMDYWAVSDLNGLELQQLAERLRR